LPEQTAQLSVRELDRSLAVGTNQVGDGLRLGQVDLAMQKGAPRELAGFGMTGALPEQRLQSQAGNQGAAMTLQFHDVFASVTVGARHPHCQALRVNALALRAKQPPQQQLPGRSFRQATLALPDPLSYLDSFRTRQTDHGHGAAYRCR
jgi:hypothetical protein